MPFLAIRSGTVFFLDTELQTYCTWLNTADIVRCVKLAAVNVVVNRLNSCKLQNLTLGPQDQDCLHLLTHPSITWEAGSLLAVNST